MARPFPAEEPSSPPAGPASDTTLMWAEFAGRLRAFVARRVPPGIEPDDVVQEVFLRVVKRLPSLRETERIEGWLFQIARNALLDAIRVRQRRDSRADAIETDIPAPPEIEDERAAAAELAPCLTPMVARLAEPYRSAIVITLMQGVTQADAARRAGVSVSGMKSRVQRAREQLKEMLLRCCEVDVDRRRGVADYSPRAPEGCGGHGHGRPTDTQTVSRDTSRTPAQVVEKPAAPSACCGGPAPAGSNACCVKDAAAKAAGASGCGCASTSGDR